MKIFQTLFFILLTVICAAQNLSLGGYLLTNSNGSVSIIGGVNIATLNSVGFVQTNANGDLLTASLTSNNITTALGFIPYNATNPSEFITITSLNPYLLSATALSTYVPKTLTINNRALSGNISITASDIGLGSVTNESKATMFTSPTFTGTATFPSGTNFTTTGNIGYVTGAGGAVTQATSKSTGVTLNKVCGTITMNNAALAAAAEVAFTLTNSTIGANDVVVVSIKSGATAAAYFLTVGATSAGSCSITLGNTSAGSLSEAVVINFVVIKSAAN